jgi:hypothetical protein
MWLGVAHVASQAGHTTPQMPRGMWLVWLAVADAGTYGWASEESSVGDGPRVLQWYRVADTPILGAWWTTSRRSNTLKAQNMSAINSL